jgi:hypothetical protein
MSWGHLVRLSANLSMLSAVLMVGACAMPDTDSYRLPSASNLFRPLSVTSYREKALPPVTAADLVDANGNCAGAYTPAVSGDQAGQPTGSPKEAAVPLMPSAITLDMTECEVVRRAGVATKAETGPNDGRERTVTLTYIGGDHPGVYSFTGGRLKSMELGPEPPAPEKIAKKKPAKPPTRRASQPDRVSVQ